MLYTYELQNNTYFASFAPFGVCKLLTRRAVAVPLGYVSLYFNIIICVMSIEMLGSISCNEIYMNEVQLKNFAIVVFQHTFLKGTIEKSPTKLTTKRKPNIQPRERLFVLIGVFPPST